MDIFIVFILGVLKITLLDLTLSGDNIGVIALVTRRMPEKQAKLASMIGISGALILRIIFACALTFILAIQWLPIRFIGGLLLIKITWDFIKPHQEEEEHELKDVSKLKDAVFAIVIADISMSLDNVLALSAAADGHVVLLIFGILLNIPIIFFGSKFVADMMNKHEIIIYIGGAILAHTSVKMIFEDQIFTKYVHLSPAIDTFLPWAIALMTLIYGFNIVSKHKKTSEGKDINMNEV